ncbi:MAG: hypothetical protein ACPL4N_01385, partial [Candidatus Norongarragalinales archaeon]
MLAASQGMSGEKIKRIGLVAEATGYLHDVARKPTESQPHGIVGQKSIQQMQQKHFFSAFTPDEISDIAAAVGLHESSWKELEEKTAG